GMRGEVELQAAARRTFQYAQGGVHHFGTDAVPRQHRDAIPTHLDGSLPGRIPRQHNRPRPGCKELPWIVDLTLRVRPFLTRSVRSTIKLRRFSFAGMLRWR